MRRLLVGLSAMAMLTGCDKLGLGEDGNSGPSMTSEGSGGGTSTSGDYPSTDGPGGSSHSTSGHASSTTSGGNPTTGAGTDGCGTEDTAADPWGDEDGCGGGLPTQSPWDVGNGGSCWSQTDRWDESCEEEPCLDYDCHSPTLCGPVVFGECDEPSGASGGSDDGDVETTGGPELDVDDPAALECILEALRDHVPITFTVHDCQSLEPVTTYEVVSNGLVIVTTEEVYGDNHWREQRIETFNYGYDFASCVGPGVDNYEKRWCVGMADSGPCPVGPVACPAE